MALSPIQPLHPAQSVHAVQPLRPAQESKGTFEKLVTDASESLNRLDTQASQEVADLAAGKTDNVHKVMLALGKSEIAFNYMLEVRNRVLDSYKEIMRMPL
jgi:flagellar hook-basal body complex protein FliE